LGALTIPAPAARTPVQQLPKKGAVLMAALMMPAMVLAGTGGATGSSGGGKCFSSPYGKRYPQTLLSVSRCSCVLLGWYIALFGLNWTMALARLVGCMKVRT
jgi:ACR3 family arsenite efflux pump ArsB